MEPYARLFSYSRTDYKSWARGLKQCGIRGETPHFDYICEGVTYGIARLNATQEIPVIYGLLTTNDLQQAKDRSGGKLGNKGDECAIDAIKMAKF